MHTNRARFGAMEARQKRDQRIHRLVDENARTGGALGVLKRRCRQHDTSAGRHKPTRVALVSEEAQVVRARAIERRDATHHNRRIANQASANLCRNVSGGDGHLPITAARYRKRIGRCVAHAVGGFLVLMPAGADVGPVVGFAAAGAAFGALNRIFAMTRSVISKFLSADTMNAPAATSKMNE